MQPNEYTLVSLYEKTPPVFNFDDLIDALQLDKRIGSLPIQIMTRLDSRLLSIDFGQKFIMQINIRLERFPAEDVAIALQGAKSTAVENDFGVRVAAHESHIAVSSKVEEAVKEKTSERRLRLYAMQMATEYLYNFARPSLLYSSLAQSLTLPAERPNSMVGRFDSRIFEQAVLSSRGGPVGSGAPIGAHVWGSEELIGKPVVFPVSDYPSWAVTQGSTRFFGHCDHYGVPADGETFTNQDEKEIYKVDHIPRSTNYPRGHIEVTIVRHKTARAMHADGSLLHPERMGRGRNVKQKAAPKLHSANSNIKRMMLMATSVTIIMVITTMLVSWGVMAG